MTVEGTVLSVAVLCSDQDVVEDVTNALKGSYPDIEVATSPSLALADIDKVKGHTLDMVVIDLDTKMDTSDVIKSIHSFSNIAIIALYSREDKNSMLKALNSGADQCIAKPFGHHEFASRADAILRIKRAGVKKSRGRQY